MRNKLLKELWANIGKNGLPLVAPGQSPKIFIDDYWDMDKLQARITCTVKGKPVARMTFAKGLINMLLLTTLDKYGILQNHADETIREFIFTGSGNVKSQDKYCEFIKDEAFNIHRKDIHEVSKLIGELKECFVQFAWIIDNKRLMDISIVDIFELCDADETIKDWIMNGPIKRDDMSLVEVEELKANCLKYIEKTINEKEIQPLKSLLAAGTGVRLPQFVDCLFMIGSRPDQDEVIPHIEKESWLRGINNEDTFYNEAYVSRCATIITKLDIKDPGSFQKMISYLNNPNYLNPDPHYMCDSIHFIEYFIKDQEDLNKVHDRYLILNNDVTNVRPIDKNKDQELIGHTVRLRSPSTCNSKVGICRYCAGEHIYFDNVKGPLDTNSNLGVVLSKRYISPIGQEYLSSKHNMVTIIQDITFNHNDKVDVFVKNIDIVYSNGEIILDDRFKLEENQYTGFMVKYKGEIFTVESDGILVLREDGNLHVVYKNKRRSKKYNDLKDLFSRPSQYENPIAELNKIVGAEYIVGEVLMRNMIYLDMKEDKVRPDFSKEFDKDSLTFVSLKTGIIKNVGIVNKLCYGQFNDILTDPENFKEVPHMNYDTLYADRSDFEKMKEKYEAKYAEEILKEEE